MTSTLRIDFVSDVTCPWCAVGLGALREALRTLDGEVEAELHFQPFELNPRMGPDGQDATEHLTEKYGSTPEQQAETRRMIRARGAEVGFAFRAEGRGRIWNTFDAHRLLHWAGSEGEPGRQEALKDAMLVACHGEGENMASHDVLVRLAESVGLDGARARAILAGDDFAEAVRERERFYTERGVHAVPAVIVDERHLISGGQPAAVFEEALRRIAAGTAEAGQTRQ